MSKYDNLYKEIFSVFDSQSWKSQDIRTSPSNYFETAIPPFIRVNVISNRNGVNNVSISGILLIDIFVPANGGPIEIARIADTLDNYFEGKSLNTLSNHVAQFKFSTMVEKGTDKADPTLFRAAYTIPFNFSGVY